MIDVKIPMRPVPKGRPRFTSKGHVYTPKDTVEAEREIGLFVKLEMSKNGMILCEGAMSMQLEFCFEGDKPYHIKGADVDNLAKTVMDSCQNILYKNDSQVIRLEASKVYGKANYIHIRASEEK